MDGAESVVLTTAMLDCGVSAPICATGVSMSDNGFSAGGATSRLLQHEGRARIP